MFIHLFPGTSLASSYLWGIQRHPTTQHWIRSKKLVVFVLWLFNKCLTCKKRTSLRPTNVHFTPQQVFSQINKFWLIFIAILGSTRWLAAKAHEMHTFGVANDQHMCYLLAV
jgi:hypothetical protein